MEEQRSVYSVLADVQHELSVPKGRTNKFGGYTYRSLEDINAAAKTVCEKHRCGYVFRDEIVPMSAGDDVRWYLKATVEFFAEGCAAHVESTAMAREEDMKKGIDEAQITGLASSYARKYAACALFAIDSGEEVDAMDNGGKNAGGSVRPRERAYKRDNEKREGSTVPSVVVSQSASQPASEEKMSALMASALEYATLRGRKTADVISALDDTKRLKAMGASAADGYTEAQADAAIGILEGWIAKAKEAGNEGA